MRLNEDWIFSMQDYDIFALKDVLQELNLTYKPVRGGREIQLEKCPFCENDRHKSSDHFSFRSDTGQFKCIKCNEQGNLITFKRLMGLDPYKKGYRKLDQKIVSQYSKQPQEYYDKFSMNRGISQETLKKYGVGMYVDKKLGSCRTYVYVDLDDKIVNVKYINRLKQMKMEYNAKKIYYGLQFINFDLDYLHVVSGEDDVHALVDMQFDNVVSVPHGDGSYNEEIGQINKRFKKIYLLFDNDKSGQEGAERFAHKAGVWKCWNVIMPYKDARECLRNGYDLFDIEKLKECSKQFEYKPSDQLRPGLCLEERLKRYEISLNLGYGIPFNYHFIDNLIGGMLPGELMSVVANPGSYKTSLLMNFIIKVATKLEYGFIMFFSLEMPVENEFERELSIVTGKTRTYFKELLKDEYYGIENFIRSYEGILRRIMVSQESFIKLDDMKEIIKRTEEVHGEPCVMVAVDYSDFVQGTKVSNDYETIKEISNGFRNKVCRDIGVPGVMLYQTNRSVKDAYQEVTARSGKGGTPIEAASDFQIGLWRNQGGYIGKVTKHRRLNDRYSGNLWPYFKLVVPDYKTFMIEDIVEIDKPERFEDEF